MLGYIVFKAVFIAFAQKSPIAQAVGLVIVEAGLLIAVSVLRPFMDKKDQHLQHLHMRGQLPQRHLPLGLLQRFRPAGDGVRSYGSDLRPLQCHLRRSAPRHGPGLFHLRHLLKEPGNTLPANAR